MIGARALRRALVAISAALLPAGAPAAPLPERFTGAPPAEFAQALEVRPFVFPRDHGPHPEFRQEWWYVTGNLDATSGERFGFELTFFRFALAPPLAGDAPPASSAWRTRTLYMAHFAVTDVARGRFRFMQKLSREALGLAGAHSAPLRVWIDDWSLAQAAVAAGAGWTLQAAQPGYEIELTLEPRGAPVLNGEAGLSRKSDEPSAASYYYSIPRLDVRGRLLRDGRPLEVRGAAWLDREWGSGALGARQAGWDWFALQLDDGSALMFYALRDRDGRRDPHSAGTWTPAQAGADAHPLASADVAIDVTGEWRNARGERYPAGWRLQVPQLALDVSVRPVLADQELATTPRYWEGAVDVAGQRAGRSVRGRGYVELVGYAQER
ncbi:MAG TPA: lipocalin-like domain-containing protein [Steroidobacteraceae bacterium]|nr:lipocalin-like domain-containing protein [Steroidobacteraceae bacterium]